MGSLYIDNIVNEALAAVADISIDLPLFFLPERLSEPLPVTKSTLVQVKHLFVQHSHL